MIGIIGAMEEEVALLRSAMNDRVVETSGLFEFIPGTLEGQDVVLLRCGIGKVNAAVGCALLIRGYAPELIINTGSAGGINHLDDRLIEPSLSFGDVIISDGLLYHDVDVTAFDYAPGQLPGQPPVFPVPPDLVRAAERAVDELKTEGILPGGLSHARGIIASGDVFMHEPERIEKLRKTFPQVRAVEMEGAAIAHACALFKVPAIIIRALSDIAGVESPVTSNEFLPVAAKHSAEIVRRIVRNYSI
jgi:adenosylhomocysteine nucleosidase